MHILIVDDEQDICEILQYNLEMEGYEVTTANSAEEALSLPLSEYSLILLDVMMGEISGFQMAQSIRRDPATQDLPIIFITALEGEDNTIRGLNIGADDYITKPLSVREVKARVNAVLRRMAHATPAQEAATPGDAPNLLSYDGIVLNLDAKTATMEGAPLTLTRLEFELLALFFHNPNIVYSRKELLKRCWPQGVYVLDRTVDVSITRLRKKIGTCGRQIKTRIGYGYIFER